MKLMIEIEISHDQIKNVVIRSAANKDDVFHLVRSEKHHTTALESSDIELGSDAVGDREILSFEDAGSPSYLFDKVVEQV